MWLKGFAASATVAGGYMYYASTHFCVTFCTSKDRKSSSNVEISSYIYPPENHDLDFGKKRFTLRKTNSIKLYWKLLLLCKSKNQKVRHLAVKSLSNLSSLDKWEYMMVAQACDARTAIGLARNISSNLNLFLPSPFRDLKGADLQLEILEYLSLLPSTNDDFIENLKRKVLKIAEHFRKHEYCINLEAGDPSVVFHSQQKKKLINLFYNYMLQILHFYSSEATYRSTIIEKGLLKILLKVLNSCANEPKILSLMGQILANIAMEEKFINDIHITGWIGILASWAKSSNIIISLPAAKALANLDKDDSFHSLYDDGIYLLNPLFRLSGEREPIADIIFIHGLLGATFWTWRQHDTKNLNQEIEITNERGRYNQNISSNYSMCWPKDWLCNDIPNLRILSVDHKTCVSNWSSQCSLDKEKNNINKKSSEIIRKLLLSKVGDRPIIWIAHSMGGLIVKRMLVDANESDDERVKALVKKTCGIIFFSVPHKGSELANKINFASHILLPSPDVLQLEKEAPSLLQLHENFRKIAKKLNISVLSFIETKPTNWGFSSLVLVPPDSADPGVGEFFTLSCDHLSTCKPESQNSFEYMKIIKFLQENLSNAIAKYYLKSPRSKITCTFDLSKVFSLIP